MVAEGGLAALWLAAALAAFQFLLMIVALRTRAELSRPMRSIAVVQGVLTLFAFAMLLIVFASLALLLASLGVYSVMAYSVTQRSAEIGIRMALGAGSGQVQKMVIGQGMKLAAIGLAIGLAGALALTRLMEALLFEVRASDPIVYLSIAAILTAVAIAACWLPSRRAAGMDPTTALHQT